MEYLADVYKDVGVIAGQLVKASGPFADEKIHHKERQIAVRQEYDPLKRTSFRIYHVRDFGAAGDESFIEVGTYKYTQYEVEELRNRISPIMSFFGKFRF